MWLSQIMSFLIKKRQWLSCVKQKGILLKCHLEVSSHFFWALRVWLPVIYFSFSAFRVRVSRKYRRHLGRERVYSRRKGNESIIQGLIQCPLFLDSLIQKKKKKDKGKGEGEDIHKHEKWKQKDYTRFDPIKKYQTQKTSNQIINEGASY